MSSDPAPPVTGMTVSNSNGGTGADVRVSGSAEQAEPSVGLDVGATAKPGQSVTGLRIIQTGPGTGMRITVGGNGPAVGARVNVGTGDK